MQDWLAAGLVAPRKHQLAHLRAGRAFQPHGGAHAKPVGDGAAQGDDHPVARVTVVTQQRGASLIVAVDDIKIAIAAQIAEGRAKTNAPFVQAPGLADVLELQVAQIAKGQVSLDQHGAVAHDAHPFQGGLGGHLPCEDVGIVGLPVHTVGDEKVEAAVVVQVFETRRPRPVRRSDAGQKTRFEAAAGASIDEKAAVKNLRRLGGLIRGVAGQAARIDHLALVLFVRGRGHVGDEQVNEAVIIHIAQVGSHGRKRHVRHHLVDDVGERSIPVVVVEPVAGAEIAGHIKIGPAVVVVIPPDGGMSLGFATDSRPLGHVREGAVAVVVKEIPALAVRMIAVIQQIGRNINIEPSVAIVVAEGGHAARILHIQSISVGHFLEGPVALVDVEQVWGVEPAHIDVQQPVVVDVNERRPLLPDAGGLAFVAHARLLGDVFEMVIAQITEQPAALGLAHDEDVRPAVAVVVPDGHPRADRAVFKLMVKLPPHLRVGIVVRGHHAGLLGRQFGEQGRAARSGTRRQRLFRDSTRGIGRPSDGTAQQHPDQPAPSQNKPGSARSCRAVAVRCGGHGGYP